MRVYTCDGMSVLIKTIGQIGLERLDRCSKEIGERFLPAVRPCFGVNKRNCPVPSSTCFFMHIDSRNFLVTAAHAIDDSDITTIYVGNGESLIPIEGNFLVTDNSLGRNKDRFDFAVLEISKEKCDSLKVHSFITESMISKNRTDKKKRSYMALGFPASMQKVAYNEPYVKTSAWTYIRFHRPSAKLESKIGVTENGHFIIRFQKKVKGFDDEVKNAVNPRGASGGVLIDLGNFDPDKLRPEAPCAGLLAAVLIEHYKQYNVIVATDIQVVINAIRGWSA